MLTWGKDRSLLQGRPGSPLVLSGVLSAALGLWTSGVGLPQAAKKHIFGMTHH